MRPIPKSLLIHKITHIRTKETDRWGKEESAASKEIERVRMEPSSKIIRDKTGAEIQLQAELFYDCKNSRPKRISFVEDDIIVFNGARYRIKTVEPLYDNKKLHHYEMGLIKDA